MPTAQSQLDIIINAKNQASPAIQSVNRDLHGMESSSNLLEKAVGALGISLGIGLVKQLAATGMELARTAAYADDVKMSFGELAKEGGSSGTTLLNSLRKASSGAIADSELMLTANRAMLLGVANNVDDLGKLMDVARVRSNAMGLTTQQAFDNIVTGIGRNSPMILDNLGIVIDSSKAYEDYAKSINKSAKELTDQEQKQAMINAVIQQSAGLVQSVSDQGGDAASKFERMDAAIQNAKEALGELFQPAMVVVANAIATAAQAAADQMKGLAEGPPEMEGLQLKLQGLNNMLAIHKKVLQDAQQGSEEYNIALHEVKSIEEEMGPIQARVNAQLEINRLRTLDADTAMRQASGGTDVLRYGFRALGDEAETAGSKIINAGLDARAAMEQFNIAMGLSRSIATAVDSAGTTAGRLFASKQGGEAGLAKQKETTAELNKQVQAWHDMGYTDKEINDVLLPGMVSQISEANNKLFEAGHHTEKLSEEATKAKEAFDNIKSSVKGVLDNALNTGTGVDPKKVLEKLGVPRADEINENARRLADIAQNGLKDQKWLGDFQKEVPDIWKMIRLAQNPQEEAAHLLQDFQDGLLTSPIDKDKAKEIVKRALLGEQKMEQLATEIATEIANEMGIPLEEALAQTKSSLGVTTGMQDTGKASADNFSLGASTSISDNQTGGAMIDTLITQVKASYEKLTASGKDAGKVWGDGFMGAVGNNIPAALISLLVNLVTPGVMAQFQQTGSLSKPAS